MKKSNVIELREYNAFEVAALEMTQLRQVLRGHIRRHGEESTRFTVEALIQFLVEENEKKEAV